MTQNKKRDYWEYINFALPILLMAFIGASILINEPKKISEIEKRHLQGFPVFSMERFFSGAYMKELGNYFSDQFPGRSELIKVADMLSFQADDSVKIYKTSTAPADSIAIDLDGGDNKYINDEGGTGAMKNNLLIYNNKGYQLFGGTYRGGKYFAEYINKLSTAFSDCKIYCTVFPTPAEFYLSGKYKKMFRSEKEFINGVYDHLDPSIKGIDAYSELEKHTGDYLYFGTDHHWTQRGAYWSYVAFCKAAGMIPRTLKSFERKVKHNFRGSFYSLTRDQGLHDNPDSVEYFVSDMKCTVYYNVSRNLKQWQKGVLFNETFQGGAAYSTFLSGDIPFVRIKTEAKNNRKILILKESYGNAFVPFFVNHFKEVIAADMRYFPFSLEATVKEYGITDILVVNNTFSAASPYFGRKIAEMIYHAVEPLVVKKEKNNKTDNDSTKSDSSSVNMIIKKDEPVITDSVKTSTDSL